MRIPLVPDSDATLVNIFTKYDKTIHSYEVSDMLRIWLVLCRHPIFREVQAYDVTFGTECEKLSAVNNRLANPGTSKNPKISKHILLYPFPHTNGMQSFISFKN